MSNKLIFPKDFLWGVSTAAYQIEGGITNDWSEWEKSEARVESLKKQGKDPNDFVCGQACDSYNRYLEDIDLVKSLSCNTYRFSIEWARVEPSEGEIDTDAINHYKNQIRILKGKGIEPIVCLWHFTNPLWIRDIGGWENKMTVRFFERYVERIVDAIGEEVEYWLTINEPQMYVASAYVSGDFPPNIKSLRKAQKVFKNIINGHIAAYNKIHEKFLMKPKVGVANYFSCLMPKNPKSFLNREVVDLLDYIANFRFVEAVGPYQDFIGFQYYHRNLIKLKWGGKYKIADVENENKVLSDMGWEIYPEGIYKLLKKVAKYKKPILITENGTADQNDNLRKDFIHDHLVNVHRAINEGVDVRGYLHWSLIDNFEWAHGWLPKFGLHEVNPDNKERTPRPSAFYYRKICKNNCLEKLSDKF